MIAGQQKRLAVPHEEGAEITLRSLGHKLLRDAQQKQIRSAMDEVKGLDIDFAALQEAVKTGDLDKSVTGGDKAKKDEAEDYTYDMDMVLEAGIVPHYMVNVTGHGWRKLMRANADFTYEITEILPAQPEFALMQKESGVDDAEMYGNFNMGVGFALFVAPEQADQVIALAEANGLKTIRGGTVIPGEKQVVITPKNLTFKSETLEVR